MSRETITRCDMCREEIGEAKPRFIVNLGIIKTKVGQVVEKLETNETLQQKEVCSHGCALAFFKAVLGNGHTEGHSANSNDG